MCMPFAPRTSGQAGVAAVEFGLILPVLMILLLGIIDYGYVLFVKQAITNAAREGARVGVTVCDAEARARTTAVAYLTDALGAGSPIAAEPTPGLSGDQLTLSVLISDFKPLVGFVPVPKTLSARATMRWELADSHLCDP